MKNRKVINPKWIPKNGNNPLTIEIIEPSDLELISNFHNNHFVKNGILWKSLNITLEECKPLSVDAIKLALKNAVSLAAFDGDKLVGILTNRIYTPAEFSKLFNGELHLENPKLEIKDDYAYDIQNGPYNLQANRIHVFHEYQNQIGKFLPRTTKNLGFFKSAAVSPEYQGSGLSRYLGNESVKLFHKYDCEYIAAMALIDITYKSAKLKGMKECFELPYSKYKENGKPVFGDLSENGESMKVLIGTVKDAMEFVLKTEKQQNNNRKCASKI